MSTALQTIVADMLGKPPRRSVAPERLSGKEFAGSGWIGRLQVPFVVGLQ
jgi:hypothetical protein